MLEQIENKRKKKSSSSHSLIQKSSEKFLEEAPADISRLKNIEDDLGSFVDSPGHPSTNYIDALDNGKAFRT